MSLSVHHTFVQFFVFDDTLNKYQWIFTKLGVYIDIMEIWAQLFKANDVVS